MPIQHKLTPGLLLNPDGTLQEEGYATSLVKQYNPENIKQSWLRRKEWDYYAILNEDFGVAFTVAELGLLSLYSAVFLDFKERKYYTDDVIRPLSFGKQALPRSSGDGEISFSNKKITLSIETHLPYRKIHWEQPFFSDKKGLFAEIELYQPPEMETMVIATSWKEDRTCFYYNQKINCLKAKGYVEFAGERYELEDPTQGRKSFGVLDWGRGVWKYKSHWYWSSLSTEHEGHMLGWNLGYGFSDRSIATENMIFYDNAAHKLGDVKFFIPEKNKRPDYMGTWKIQDDVGRLDITFVPILDRFGKFNLLLLKSIQHQVFGYFTGKIILDDGEEINIKNKIGFAEYVYNRW